MSRVNIMLLEGRREFGRKFSFIVVVRCVPKISLMFRILHLQAFPESGRYPTNTKINAQSS